MPGFEKRRSAEEWMQLIRELERSGQDPTSFARARGIRPDTLKWWRWRLGRKTKPRAPTRDSTRVKLVAVRPSADKHVPDRSGATPVWEIVTPTGHELRVYDRRGLGVLRAALFAVAGNRRR